MLYVRISLGFVLLSGNAHDMIWGIGVEATIVHATNMNTHRRMSSTINNKSKYILVCAGRCCSVAGYDTSMFCFCLQGLFPPFQLARWPETFSLVFKRCLFPLVSTCYTKEFSLVPGHNLPTGICYPVPQYRSSIPYPSPFYEYYEYVVHTGKRTALIRIKYG